MPAGRFAPSPTGDLHIGNLRTALLAWLFARSTGRQFLVRIEDLDRVRAGSERGQLDDLRAIGIDWDGETVRQSERTALYARAVAELRERGLVYECFCSRRDIREAASAPHAPQGAYPETCRDLTEAERAAKGLIRPAALRLRSDVTGGYTITDEIRGSFTGTVDDMVLVRNEGAVAYNLAVVLDDTDQGIDQVVRGDDLIYSTPRQVYLARLLNLPVPTFVHVPLALNAEGQRLAKRDGAVTLAKLAEKGITAGDARTLILESLGLAGGEPSDILQQFDPRRLPREPWTFIPPA